MNAYFALDTPKIETDPDINNIVLVIFAMILIMGISTILWQAIPILYEKRKRNITIKAKAANSIWYESKESQLYCGYNNMRIEPKSYEHYVCKITFSAPFDYHNDYDIQDEKDNHTNSSSSIRGVEQAVRRLNKKANEMGLKNSLFKRSKERTSVNDIYRTRIVKR